jgi:hypothetical protein
MLHRADPLQYSSLTFVSIRVPSVLTSFHFWLPQVGVRAFRRRETEDYLPCGCVASPDRSEYAALGA